MTPTDFINDIKTL